ncbi:MAG TPA: outer membrane beta-barrel protein [Verrucomicrobiae bacterium]|nr:outer membrane beta-barrel protein [Verrucomicrobiae bacterium]
MKQTTRVVLTLGAASLAVNAHARERDFYLSLDAGASIIQDVNIKGGNTIELNPGARIDGAFGWQFSRSLAAEFETGITLNSVEKIGGVAVSSYGGSADIYQVPMLVNLVYTPPTHCKIKPFIGAGGGGIATIADMQTPLGNVNDTDFTFGYQGFAGVKWTLSRCTDIGLTYKFMGSLDHNWSSGGVALKTDAIFTHALLLSFRWKF